MTLLSSPSGRLVPPPPPQPERPEHDPRSPSFWEYVRETPGELPSSLATRQWFEHVVKAVAYCLQQVGADEQGAGASLLDVSAGMGWIGKLLRDSFPAMTYHATEQTARLCDAVRERTGSQSVALWRLGTPGGESLHDALGADVAEFEPAYSIVLLHHVVDCVDHHAGYDLLDQAWELVQPAEAESGKQGFLVVTVQRQLVHRVHEHVWSWDALVGHLCQYARPVICFDDAIGGSSISAAIWKPPAGTPRYPPGGSLHA